MEKIDKDFLVEEGWVLLREYPLGMQFKKGFCTCMLGPCSISIVEWHWLNQDKRVREFTTIGKSLSRGEYHKIIKIGGFCL